MSTYMSDSLRKKTKVEASHLVVWKQVNVQKALLLGD